MGEGHHLGSDVLRPYPTRVHSNTSVYDVEQVHSLVDEEGIFVSIGRVEDLEQHEVAAAEDNQPQQDAREERAADGFLDNSLLLVLVSRHSCHNMRVPWPTNNSSLIMSRQYVTTVLPHLSTLL